jgi:hypothetical protein
MLVVILREWWEMALLKGIAGDTVVEIFRQNSNSI